LSLHFFASESAILTIDERMVEDKKSDSIYASHMTSSVLFPALTCGNGGLVVRLGLDEPIIIFENDIDER
jgi:hypothetical protein